MSIVNDVLNSIGQSSQHGAGVPTTTPVKWHPCVLTWYDPALGGTNSSSGRADPHSKTSSGQPYSPTAMTCAAPGNFPFGTVINFRYGGKVVTCKVNDRGGAITGVHFDLARAPATQLGIISAGLVKAEYSVGGADPLALLNQGTAAGNAAANLGNNPIADVLHSIVQFFLGLFSANLWIRIGEVILGGIMLVIGGWFLTQTAMGKKPSLPAVI